MDKTTGAKRQPQRVSVHRSEDQPRDASGKWTRVSAGRVTDTSPSVPDTSSHHGGSRAGSRAPSRASSVRSTRTPRARSQSTGPSGSPVVPAGVAKFRMHEGDNDPIPADPKDTAGSGVFDSDVSIDALQQRFGSVFPSPPANGNLLQSAKNVQDEPQVNTPEAVYEQFLQHIYIYISLSYTHLTLPTNREV